MLGLIPSRQIRHLRAGDTQPLTECGLQRCPIVPWMLNGAETHRLLMPLAAGDHEVTAPSHAAQQSGSPRRGRALSRRCAPLRPPFKRTPSAISDSMDSSDSVRGSSAVRMVRSASSAEVSAIIRRLALIAQPGRAKDRDHASRLRRRAAPSHARQQEPRAGRWACGQSPRWQ